VALGRFDQALADFAAAFARRPLDGHLQAYRGICLFHLKRYAPALEQHAKELTAFRAEAEAVLAGSADDLPADVFANPR